LAFTAFIKQSFKKDYAAVDITQIPEKEYCFSAAKVEAILTAPPKARNFKHASKDPKL
jgi:hypothetical protein